MAVHKITQANLVSKFADQVNVLPGDVLLLRGDYVVPDDVSSPYPASQTEPGEVDCSLVGAAGNPVIIDARNARMNGGIHFLGTGDYTRLIGLDAGFLNWTTRITDASVYPPIDLPAYRSKDGGMQLHMPNVEIVNCKLHDFRGGIGSWISAVNALTYGCLLYHNGWYDPTPGDHAHGEGQYTQNSSGVKIIKHCMGCNNYDHVLAIYGTSVATSFFRVLENIFCQDGLQFGGVADVVDVLLSGNLFYAKNDIPIGFNNAQKTDITLTQNILSMSPNQHRMIRVASPWTELNIVDNPVIFGNLTTIPVFLSYVPDGGEWDYNTYYYVPRVEVLGAPFAVATSPTTHIEMGFAAWKSYTGFDAHSTFNAGYPPSEAAVHLNEYEEGRAHVAIYNWTQASSFPVDLTGLPDGRYRAYNLQNLSEYFTFAWDGETDVNFPMTGWTVAKPIGWSNIVGWPFPETSSFPEFGAFLVTQVASGQVFISVSAGRPSIEVTASQPTIEVTVAHLEGEIEAIAHPLAAPPETDDLTLYLNPRFGAYTTQAGAIGSGNGAPVGLLQDQSGNGFDVSIASASARPILLVDQLKGQSALSFSGSKRLQSAAGVTLADLITATAFTMYLVIKPVAIDTNDATIYNNDAIFTDEAANLALQLKSAPTAHGYVFDGAGNRITTSSVTLDAWQVVQWRLGGGFIKTRVGRDGAESSTAVLFDTVNLSHIFKIGCNFNASQFYNGLLAALLVYRAHHGDDESETMFDWIEESWGV